MLFVLNKIGNPSLISEQGYPYPIYQPLRSGRIWHKVNF